jgi:hypothetical protein
MSADGELMLTYSCFIRPGGKPFGSQELQMVLATADERRSHGRLLGPGRSDTALKRGAITVNPTEPLLFEAFLNRTFPRLDLRHCRR